MRKLLRRRYSVATWIPVGAVALAAVTMVANRGASELRVALQETPTPLYQVNAGDCGSTDWSGTIWEADQSFDEEWGFVGGRSSGSWDLDVDDVYQCASVGQSFDYRFALQNGEYRVELHFLEPELEAGERQFDVRIEGKKVLEGFDIAAESGGTATGIERSFVATVEDGRLEIGFEGGETGALVNAISVEQLSLVEQPDSASEGESDAEEAVDEQPEATPIPIEEPTAEQPAEQPETAEGKAPDENVEPTEEAPAEEPVAADDSEVDEQPVEEEQNPPANEALTTDTGDEESAPEEASAYVQYVNAGQCDPVRWDGNDWAADQAYSVGSWGYVGDDYFARGPGFAEVSDPAGNSYGDNGQYLHRCRAFGTDFGYRFDLPNGEYDLRLRFVEPLREPGQRLFVVLVEGQLALDDFDIAAETGGVGVATEAVFLVTVSDGQLAVDFVGDQPDASDQNAIVQAIAVTTHQEVDDEPDEAPTPTAEPPAEIEQPPEGEQPADDPEPTPTLGEEPSVEDPPATEEPTEEPGDPEEDTTPETPGADRWYVNAGSCGDVQWSGQVWLGDQAYTAGSWGHVGSDYHAVADDVADPVYDESLALYGTEGQYLHQCQVYGQDFGYQFDLPNGSYEVHLRFAEPLYQPGERWFDVLVEGAVALDNFDASQAAGGPDIAVERAFIVAVADGQLRIDLVGGQSGSTDPNAFLQALSVYPAGGTEPTPDPATPEPTTPAPEEYEDPPADPTEEAPGAEEPPVDVQPYALYVNAGQCDAVEWDGVTWAADQAYSVGSWGHVGDDYFARRPGYAQVSDPAGNSYGDAGQYLHRCRAFGTDFGYRFDVPNGDYSLQLRLVEPLRNPGKRFFDVVIEGQTVLDNFDITAETGGVGIVKEVTFLVTVSDGQLAVDFVGNQPGSSDGNAIVQALVLIGEQEAVSDPPPADDPEPTPTLGEEPSVEDPPATEEPTEEPGDPEEDTTPETPGADRWYVNAGSCGDVQWSGQVWLGDQAYTAGSWGHVGSDYHAVADDVADPVYDESLALYGTEGQYLHQCQVYGQDFGYQFDLPNGSYEVHLRFAEPLYQPGERWFDVLVEGAVALDNFDASQAAGGPDIAVERAFIVAVADGQLRIDLVGGQSGSTDPNAFLQALSVYPAGGTEPTPDPATPEPTTPAPEEYEDPPADPTEEAPGAEEPPVDVQPYALYVNAGQCDAVEWDGVTWAADQAYTVSWGRVGSYRAYPNWGPLISDSSGVSYNGDAQALHRCRVQGRDFGYRFDVPNGTYIVRLRFAEPRFGPGRRWFDVSIEDEVVLDNFDIAAEAGQRRVAIERAFKVEVTDGRLAIDFWGRQPGSYAQHAMVQALGIVGVDTVQDPPNTDPPVDDGQVTPMPPTPTPDTPTATPETPVPPTDDEQVTPETPTPTTETPDMPTPTPEPTTPPPTPIDEPEELVMGSVALRTHGSMIYKGNGQRFIVSGTNIDFYRDSGCARVTESHWTRRVQVVNRWKQLGINAVRFNYYSPWLGRNQSNIDQFLDHMQLAAQNGIYTMPSDHFYTGLPLLGIEATSFPLFRAIVEGARSRGFEDYLIMNPYNEPYGIGSPNSCEHWQQTSRATLDYLRNELGFYGLVVLDTRQWATQFEPGCLQAVLDYDASLRGGTPNVVFSNHWYPNISYNNYVRPTIDNTTFPLLIGEIGQINPGNTPLDPGYVEQILDAVINTGIPNGHNGVFPWIWNWCDINTMTEGDFVTLTDYGEIIEDQYYSRVGE